MSIAVGLILLVLGIEDVSMDRPWFGVLFVILGTCNLTLEFVIRYRRAHALAASEDEK